MTDVPATLTRPDVEAPDSMRVRFEQMIRKVGCHGPAGLRCLQLRQRSGAQPTQHST